MDLHIETIRLVSEPLSHQMRSNCDVGIQFLFVFEGESGIVSKREELGLFSSRRLLLESCWAAGSLLDFSSSFPLLSSP